MTKSSPSQLGLFDSTSLGWGFDLGHGSAGSNRFHETSDSDDRAVSAPTPVAPHVPALTYRLAGDRALSTGWKARAADNIAAIRLARQIEDNARPATADEQERLAKFIGFGASDLANSFFRRAGEAFRPGWEDLGHELEQLVSAEEMSALARSVQLYVTWNIHRIGVDGQGGKYEHNCGVAEPLADVGHSGTSARLAEHARRSRAGTAHNRRLRARCFDVFGVQRGIRR